MMERGKGDFSKFTFDPKKHYTRVLVQEGRAFLDSDIYEYAEIQDHFERTTRNDVIGLCGVPEAFNKNGFKIVYDKNNNDLTITAGRIYVDGLLCELENDVDYLHQPDLYNLQPLNVAPGRADLIYLDVWQRQITAIEDQDIREVALGGPDTSTRLKTVWQVKVIQGVGDVTCDTVGDWQPQPSGGQLSTDVAPTSPSDPCHISAAPGYRGLENHLYRVEIHSVDAKVGTKFKWSRENGSVVFAIDSFLTNQNNQATQLKLKQIGRDDALSLPVGAWVEILDDATVDAGLGGVMAKVAAPLEESDLLLTLDHPIDVTPYDLTNRHPRVRRWDQVENVGPDGLITVDTDQTHPFMQLEDGVTIHFYGDNFNPGDYWAFEARTNTGVVKHLDHASPQGIEHHYCCLALVKWKAGGADPDVSDCRNTFPPLITQKPAPSLDWPRVTNVNWVNDTPMDLVDFFTKGLVVTFSEPMDPATATLDTFIVVIEFPDPQLELWLIRLLEAGSAEFTAVSSYNAYQPRYDVSNLGLLGHRPFILYGTVAPDPYKGTMWQFTPKTIVDGQTGTNLMTAFLKDWLSIESAIFQKLKPPPPIQIRCRVMLKGNAIYAKRLDDDGAVRPLDGDTIALSTPLPTGLTSPPPTNLVLPSGDGIRGGDFESWFYLAQPTIWGEIALAKQPTGPLGEAVFAEKAIEKPQGIPIKAKVTGGAKAMPFKVRKKQPPPAGT